MKSIYLRIEHYKGNQFIFSEFHEAKIDKDYVYFGKYKVKKVETEPIPSTEKSKIIPGKDNRLIKVYVTPKDKDSRFISIK